MRFDLCSAVKVRKAKLPKQKTKAEKALMTSGRPFGLHPEQILKKVLPARLEEII